MTRFHAILAAAALTAAAALPVGAQLAQPLETRLEARKVATAADGRETLVPAESAKPGDVIEYAATYRNAGQSALTGLQATMPIPANTEYLPGSARPASAKASVDGRSFADIPLKRKVRRDGREVEEPVPWREYRYLRWSPGELGGEKSVTYTARVRVVDDRPAAEPPKGAAR